MHNKGRLKPLLHFLQRGVKMLQDFNTGSHGNIKLLLQKNPLKNYHHIIQFLHSSNQHKMICIERSRLFVILFFL